MRHYILAYSPRSRRFSREGLEVRIHLDLCRRGALAATPDALVDASKELQARGADAILLDCIGSTERHREALLPLGLPVILSNAVVANALS